MRGFWMLVTAAVLTMCTVAGCVREAEKTYSDQEQVINVSSNQNFFIALDCGDPESGFRWQENYDAAIVMLDYAGSGYETSGVWQFKFKALKTGETEIKAIYVELEAAEPSEGNHRQVFTVTIK